MQKSVILKVNLDASFLIEKERLKVEDMKIREISIQNFKSLYNVSFEPGKLNVFIGANAVVLEGVHLHEGSVVGAGAVVIKDVLKNQTVVGVPAKVIKENTVWELNEELR